MFHILWYYESDFGTLLQEEGWTCAYDVWSRLPRSVFDRFINESWTTNETFLEQCLRGPVRILTVDMMRGLPMVYTCSKCGRKCLKPVEGCEMTATQMDLPDKKKLFFLDADMVVHVPPRNSTVWARLGFKPEQVHDDGSLQPQELVQEPAQ